MHTYGYVHYICYMELTVCKSYDSRAELFATFASYNRFANPSCREKFCMLFTCMHWWATDEMKSAITSCSEN